MRRSADVLIQLRVNPSRLAARAAGWLPLGKRRPSVLHGADLAVSEAINDDRETPIEIRKSKYINNLVEQDYRAIKRRTRPMLGYSVMERFSQNLKMKLVGGGAQQCRDRTLELPGFLPGTNPMHDQWNTYASPRHHADQQCEGNSCAAAILRSLGQFVLFKRDPIDRSFDARINQFDQQHKEHRDQEYDALDRGYPQHERTRRKYGEDDQFLPEGAFLAPCGAKTIGRVPQRKKSAHESRALVHPVLRRGLDCHDNSCPVHTFARCRRDRRHAWDLVSEVCCRSASLKEKERPGTPWSAPR